ncbi:MAG: PQQ-binding-like beta-propeller repeat protein [Acidobacteria bacterium]|nr:PQQ-binding-like beta-propeller repeat protein [Acidobacteriota bacterium]
MLRTSYKSYPGWNPSGFVGVCTVLAFTLFQLLPAASAENWPQWRGPSSNAISDSSDLPTQWSTKENVKWKAPLAGLGTSSPIVWEDRIFVTSQIGRIPLQQGMYPLLARDDRDLASRENPIGGRDASSNTPDSEVYLTVESFRRSDGKRLWEFKARATGDFPELHEKHNLATPTPATDGNLIYAWFGTGQLFALDMDGQVVWKRHLGKEYAPFTTRWGHGSSPTLYKDRLFLLCDHAEDSYLLALDKKTGKELWKVDRGDKPISHSTPLVINTPEGEEMIINSSDRIDAYDPSTGKLLWHAGTWRQTPIPTPVFHEGVIYMVRGYRNSDFLAIRPAGRGDVTDTGILWRSSGGASYVPSILYYKGLLYVTNEVGIVTCADAVDGKTIWRKRLGGIFFASPVAGNGKVYMVSETGETFVLEAGREPNIMSQNPLEERIIASPAISNGNLILRSDETLFCIGK